MKTKTPGYNCRLTVRFSLDRNGRRLAHYLSRNLGSWRWIRMPLANAEVFVAMELADVESTSMPAVACS